MLPLCGEAYAKYLLAAQGPSIGTLIGNIRYVARFLEYWLVRYPERTSLTERHAASDSRSLLWHPTFCRMAFSGLSILSHQLALPTVCLIRISPPATSVADSTEVDT